MKVSDDQINDLMVAVSEDYASDLMFRYGPQALYDALRRDARAQDPPYSTTNPAALYAIARRHRWPSVTEEVAAMRAR